MAEIFLSYRRQDSQSATGRLADRLEERFGDERVFRDHDIAAGENFVEAIRRSVESSTVVLAIVGRRWLDASDAEGRRRLDDPADFVRLEIELALQARVPVVPVLVEGATMPAADELAPLLEAFARCQAVELSETRWQYDFDRLVETLRSRFGIESDRSPLDSGATDETGTLTRWGVDLFDLARHPQRLIARRQTGRASEPVHAFAFLCAAILLGNLMLLTVIDLDLVARGSPLEVVLGVAGWLLTALVLGLFIAGLLIGVLALAWRIADRSAGYRRVGLIGAYVYGGAWIGLCVFAVLAVTAVHLTDPGWLGRAVGGLHASLAASAPVAMPPMTRLDTAPMRGAASVLLVLGALVLVATAIWSVVAWGAFRQAFAATRPRSWLATSLWLALLAALVWLPLQLV